MLKRISELLIVLLIVQTGAYAPLAYAASDTIVLSHIQAGVGGGATQEVIGLFNNSFDEVNVTDWCLQNKNDSDIACFSEPDGNIQFIVPAQGSVLVASESFMAQQSPDVTASLIYTPLNSSSGSIVGSNDRISIVDVTGEIIDQHSWTSGSGTTRFQRQAVEGTAMLLDTDAAIDWIPAGPGELPTDQLEERVSIDETPVEPVVHPVITEILPNVTGSDSGNEYIELYNPSETPIDLTHYALWLGLEPKSPVRFPEGSVVEPDSYFILTNSAVAYSLVNTSGKVMLATENGEAVSMTDIYSEPRDDQAWAFIDGGWRYTNQLTPGTKNVPMLEEPSVNKPSAVALLKPCASNQYRHPETRRCRLLVAQSSSLPKPCQPNQYRHPETNRCRKITTATMPTPCKAGQERNPETGRCRTVKQMTRADYGVLSVQTSSQPNQWYIVGAVVALLGILVSYAVWEWREELRVWAQKSWRFVQRRK